MNSAQELTYLFHQFFSKLGETLDIPESEFQNAKANYEDVGDWLAAPDSTLIDLDPDIYVQGSFRLGTVVRPIQESDEYDIDLVCNLNLQKDQISQDDLKQLIGDRLKARDDLNAILSESRRCWTLDYPGQFHMDVLPAIPNPRNPPNGIQLTDTDLKNWQKSNPKAYAEWFYNKMLNARAYERRRIAKAMSIAVDEVPEWRIITPLQRIVQLLKRHRDYYFIKSPDLKPPSIIITTLVSLAYTDQENLMEAMKEVLPKIESNIEKKGNRWILLNPVDPEENFADKWNDYPERKVAFDEWLKRVIFDLAVSPFQVPIRSTLEKPKITMGQKVIDKVASDMGLNTPKPSIIQRDRIVQRIIPKWIPTGEDISHVEQPPWKEGEQYDVTVKASIHSRKHGGFLGWLRGMLVPKQSWIKFEATTSAPAPYQIKWQVVNTGHEARRVSHGLRGEFYDGEESNGSIRWESTAYFGNHWVEAFVIRDEVCLGRSGPFEVPIGPERGMQQFKSVAD